jgi:hypothetical protein
MVEVRKRAARENKSAQLADNEGDTWAWSASRRNCPSVKRVGGAHPGGNADVFDTKGFAGKAIRKTMKTKGRQLGNFWIGLLAVGLLVKEDLGRFGCGPGAGREVDRLEGGWRKTNQTWRDVHG